MPTTPKTDTSPPTGLLTIAEVAHALGVEVRHVRRLVQEKRIPYIKWGHLLRFDPTDIAAWIDTYRRYPRVQADGDDNASQCLGLVCADPRTGPP